MGASSNFPQGFLNGLTVRNVPVLQMFPGEVLYVNSSSVSAKNGVSGSDSSGGNRGTRRAPYASINAALDACVANRGDIILLMPGHAETVSASTSVVLDVAGVAVIGLGYGSLRPTLNVSATGAYVAVTAANVMLQNILITGGIDAITKVVSVSAADVLLSDIEYRDVTGQCTDFLVTTAAADRLVIDKLKYKGATAAGTNAGIAIVGGSDIEITIDSMDGNFAVGGIDVRTTATTNLRVYGVKRFRTRNAADIFIVDTVTASTGQVGPDINIQLLDDAANITEACTGATFVYMQDINIVNLAGQSSILSNITASLDA